MLDITHLLFAFALIWISNFPLILGMIASILPDLDASFHFMFPFVHRGFLHTPLFMLAGMVVIYALSGSKKSCFSFGLGYSSHLVLDTFTYSGIMWLFPLKKSFSLQLLTANSFAGNLSISVFSIIVIVVWQWQTELIAWIGKLNGFWR